MFSELWPCSFVSRPNQNICTALIQMRISAHFATVKFQTHIFVVCYSLHLKHSQLFHEVMFDLSMNFILLIFSNGPYTGSVGVHLFMNCYVLAWVSVWSFCNLMQSGFWGIFLLNGKLVHLLHLLKDHWGRELGGYIMEPLTETHTQTPF